MELWFLAIVSLVPEFQFFFPAFSPKLWCKILNRLDYFWVTNCMVLIGHENTAPMCSYYNHVSASRLSFYDRHSYQMHSSEDAYLDEIQFPLGKCGWIDMESACVCNPPHRYQSNFYDNDNLPAYVLALFKRSVHACMSAKARIPKQLTG